MSNKTIDGGTVMFNSLFALIGNFASLITATPIEDVLLILSACGVAVVYSGVMLARAIRRRVTNSAEQ